MRGPIEMFRIFLASLVTVFVYCLLYFPLFFVRANFTYPIQKYPKQILFVSNHRSSLDMFFIAQSLPLPFLIKHLPVRILAGTYFSSAFRSLQVLKSLGIIPFIYFLYFCVPVARGNTTEEKLRLFQKALDKKYSGLIFPEGTINHGKGVKEIKNGITILREKNPGLAFVFVALKYEKSILPFFGIPKLTFSEPNFEQSDDYKLFVKNKLEGMLCLS